VRILTDTTPLEEAATLISDKVFGGIPFQIKEQDSDDSSPTLILKHAFVGIVAELFGGIDGYTIELGTRPSASVEGINEVADLSPMLKQQLECVPGVVVVTTNLS
jgi:hypothetical protein